MPLDQVNQLEDAFDTVKAHRKGAIWDVEVQLEGVRGVAVGGKGEAFDLVIDRAHHELRQQFAANGAES